MHAAIVGYCDLSSPDAEDILKRQSEHKRMRGIRHMLNFHKTHPEYNAVSHDNYLTDPNWIRGFALLEKYNLSFELHLLCGQMKRYWELVIIIFLTHVMDGVHCSIKICH